LVLELGDWKLLRIGPAELFDLPLDQSERSGRIEVPIRADAMLPAEIDVEFEAYRELTEQQARISLTFPRPVVDAVTPASISIVAADNLDLTPLTGELVGLTPDPTSRVQAAKSSGFNYRDLGSSEGAQFVATLRKKSRLVTASAQAAVRIDRRQWQVEQRLNYHVAHEPQHSFALNAPPEAVAAGNLQLWFDGEPLTIEQADEVASAAGSPAAVRFSLPVEKLGAFQVVARYHSPLTGWDGQKPLGLTIPLALPAETGDYRFTGQQIDFALAEGMQLEADLAGDEDSFQPNLLQRGGASPAYSWTESIGLTNWILAPAQAIQSAHVIIERMWIQTWLTPYVRQERAVFQIRSPQETIRVRLPKGVPQSRVQAAVDGVEVAKSFRDPGQIVLSLPAAARRGNCTLEIFYALDPPVHHIGLAATRLQAAQIDGASPPRRSYWQLALPEGEHLLTLPREMTAEMDWDPGRWLMSRRAALDEQQLQRWIGASRQQTLPRSANLYLFGGLGQPPALDIVAAQRRLIIAAASGLILGIGLLVIHVPLLRRPTALLGLAVALPALALAAPDLALLVGQGALLGAAIACAVALWNGLRAGKTRVAPSPSTITARAPASAIKSPPVVRADRSSQITATAPAAAIEVRP
jgi:hypothetical protein